MGNGTCTSDLIRRFSEMAKEIKGGFDAHIWLVEVLGRRHSYLAGERDDSFLPPRVIYLNERYALVSGEWEKIPEERINSLIKDLKEAMKT